MNKSIIFYNLGRLTSIASLLVLLPALISVIYRDGFAWTFLIPASIMLIAGLILCMKKPKDKNSYAREGFVTVSMMWLILSFFGSLPFVFSGCIPSFTDAFFETVSGFTTTGSTILNNVEALPPSMHFWRSFTHWVGGMGVLALAIAIMPGDSHEDAADNGHMHLLRAETPGPTFGKLVAKLRYSVRILYSIYAVMTVIQIVLLYVGGMPLFDCIVSSFATAGTGGFAVWNSSIAHYDSAYVDAVISVFMVLFGTNFNIYFFLLTGNFMKILKSEELRWYLGIVFASTLLITLNIMPQYHGFTHALRYAFFQVSSIITTTGFITANYDLWPVFSQVILFLLMFCGACVSSTAGGLKISRVIILIKNAFHELRRQFNPREVRVVRCDGEAVHTNVSLGVNAYFAVYMLIMALSVFLVALDGKDLTTTLTSVITCLNNVGPGFGDTVGAVGNFSQFSVFSKLILCFDMLAGRLEIFPLLIALSPSVWKRNV